MNHDCAECQKPIPEERRVCVWDNSSGRIRVRFICEACSDLLEKKGAVQDITDELKAARDEFTASHSPPAARTAD